MPRHDRRVNPFRVKGIRPGLALLAAAKLNVTPEPKAAIVERLLAQQDKEGGWITDYDLKRKPIGRSNVETTCLAILALDAVVKTG